MAYKSLNISWSFTYLCKRQTESNKSTIMERKLFMLLAFCFNLCMLRAQDVYPPESTKDIHLEGNWKDNWGNDNKDLSKETYAKYSRKRLFIWSSSGISSYYLLNKQGKIILTGVTSSDSEVATISLCTLPKGTYTLYLYEGDRFWYGTFTLER